MIRSAEQSEVGIHPTGYRLPDTAHPGPVRLLVSNLDESVAFYTSVLGLESRHLDDGAAALGTSERVLVELRADSQIRERSRRGRLGLFHFALLVPRRSDLARFVRHLAASGIRAGMSDHLVSEAVYLHDPDGLGIEVYADRPRDSWRHVGRELEMATNPLDLSDLLSEAGADEWTGMPPGTTMGHVHLHVGDLDDAAAFYHHGLGLDKVVWSYPGALFLSAGGYHHHLGVNTWGTDAAPEPGEARMKSWTLSLPSSDDAGAAAENLRGAGYDAGETDRGWSVVDPWGTRLELVAAE